MFAGRAKRFFSDGPLAARTIVTSFTPSRIPAGRILRSDGAAPSARDTLVGSGRQLSQGRRLARTRRARHSSHFQSRSKRR